MTNDRIIFFALLIIVAIFVIVGLKWRQRVNTRKYIDQVKSENLEMQQFIIAKLDAIYQLLTDADISKSDLQQKVNTIIAEMESRDIRGDLGPLIADTRDQLAAEVNKRESV
jgi:RecB family endonuclease NucS